VESLILVVHVLLAVAVIGFVLIQHGKGADAGAAFGSGSSGTVFGGDSVVQPVAPAAPVDDEVPALVPSGADSDTGADAEMPNVNQ